MNLISVNNIHKEYKISKRGKGLLSTFSNLFISKYEVKKAVENISFSINKGDMVGFVGPNGAGKSTTIKMLCGILHPSKGEIKVGGLIPYKNRKEYVKNIGVVFGQKSQLWWDLPVIESYEMFKHIYNIPEEKYKQQLEMINEILDINDFFDQPVRQLSLGQRVKADIGAALLHSPEILFLDEPTIGLDVVTKESIRVFLKKINKELNITMIFTTHDMQDIEQTCNRMIIIDKGVKIFDGLLHEIKDRFGKYRILEIEFIKNYKGIYIQDAEVIYEKDNTKRFRFHKDKLKVQDLIADLSRNYEIKDLTIKEPEIESIIREIYQGGLTL